MARQLIVDYLPFEITREQIAESLKENNGRLIVHGVLQRSDAKNQNGRVYPHGILTRESQKYAENFVTQSAKAIPRDIQSGKTTYICTQCHYACS